LFVFTGFRIRVEIIRVRAFTSTTVRIARQWMRASSLAFAFRSSWIYPTRR
jgi:hypothetical protein